MTLRPGPGRVTPVVHDSPREDSDSVDRTARRRALERAYPLAMQLAEILELEAIEPLATSVRHIRQAIGAELAEVGSALFFKEEDVDGR